MRFEYNNEGTRRFLPNAPEVTRNIIIINIIMFIATLVNKSFMTSAFSMFYPGSSYFHWWQLFTHLFMHGGFLHIFFNMWMLYMFGSVIEQLIGSKKFLILYFVCGLGAVALHYGAMSIEAGVLEGQIEAGSTDAFRALTALKSTPILGASGAIFGVLMAYAMLFPQSQLTLIFPPISLSARTWIIICVVLELVLGIRGVTDGIAHLAHVGGMLIGYLLIRYWRQKGTLFNRN